MSITYRVYITPRISTTGYGTELEITDYVLETGVSTIRRGIDSTDYDIGAFFYDDLQLKCANIDGYFNDETDYRSIFKFSRDLAKIRVVYENSDDDTIVFRGLINEEATRIDVTKEEIQFRVLSRDSILRTVRVAGGTLSNSSSIRTALTSILNVPAITAVLNFSLANINPVNNITIDDASQLEDKSTREALNQLLLASNSVLIVDENDNIIVRSRDHNTGTDILNLYGAYDLKRRQNIIDIKNYNSGKQRMFTAVRINDTERANTGYIEAYGYRQKKITMDFLTSESTEIQVANTILDEFKAPKIELEVTVPTQVARSAQVLDRVSVTNPLRIEPSSGNFLPIIGVAKIGDTLTPLPNTYGSTAIPSEMGFKIIEIKEDPRTFETTLKLRQIGNDTGDGFFTSDTCGIIGFATIGVSTICGTGDIADGFNPSVIGAAIIGYTELVS